MGKGLWRNDPETPEGKYPIVLRRDGTPLENRFIVLTLRDPCTYYALEAYARKLLELTNDGHASELGFKNDDDARQFAKEVRDLADEAFRLANENPGDPGASRHREDDQETLEWARKIGNPGA